LQKGRCLHEEAVIHPLLQKRYSTNVEKYRAGELTGEELERIVLIMQNPRQYKVPDYFLNRQKDIKDGKYTQVLANGVDNAIREDLERMKKIKAHRGLRHYWGLRVRGQHTKTTGRKGRTVGVSKKKGGNLKRLIHIITIHTQMALHDYKILNHTLSTLSEQYMLIVYLLLMRS